jgi:hypothetical protein
MGHLMSRGPGRVQRFILDRLAAYNEELAKEGKGDKYPARWYWVANLAYECFVGPLPDGPVDDWPVTRAQEESTRRACRQLAKAGKVEIGHGQSRFYAGWSKEKDPDANWMHAGTDLRVRLPLTPEESEVERERDRQNLERLLGRLGGAQ